MLLLPAVTLSYCLSTITARKTNRLIMVKFLFHAYLLYLVHHCEKDLFFFSKNDFKNSLYYCVRRRMSVMSLLNSILAGCVLSLCLINSFCSQCDPSILGGMIVSVGDKYVDMSTKSKIQKLTKLIRDT